MLLLLSRPILQQRSLAEGSCVLPSNVADADVGADQLSAPEDGSGLGVGDVPHGLVVDAEDEVPSVQAAVLVHGAVPHQRGDHHAVHALVHHFDVDAQLVGALLDLDGPFHFLGEGRYLGRPS